MPSRFARRGFDAILFVVFALALIAANRSAIETRNVEWGDFAANSLLIEVAKSGHLLVGNYSRVGFNHPGPAILDVLALGEAVFFDLLHWVPSPFSGQLVAVALYNAFWMVLIVRLWRRLANTAVAAMCGATVFFITAALLDARFYSGPWFPHLYFFPFATFMLAATRLGLGKSDAILSLALSLGFLINGHVAFVPITLIIIATVLMANWIEFRKRDDSRVVMWPSWWSAHHRALLLGLLAVSIFLVPLVIETTRRYPGPIFDYLRFGSGHGRNGLKAALRFVAMYWGGLPFLVLPVALAAIVYRSKGEDGAPSQSSRIAAAVAIGASIAVLFYAVFGVDNFSLAYIAYFYCAVPAFVAASALSTAIGSTASSRNRGFVVLVSVVIIVIASSKLHREGDYSDDYNADAIESLTNKLTSISHRGRIVFDFASEPDRFATWPVVTGVELAAIRRGDDLICIGDQWHVVFTTQARCTADEVAQGRHVVVRRTSDARRSAQPLIAEAMGASFFHGEPR